MGLVPQSLRDCFGERSAFTLVPQSLRDCFGERSAFTFADASHPLKWEDARKGIVRYNHTRRRATWQSAARNIRKPPS